MYLMQVKSCPIYNSLSYIYIYTCVPVAWPACSHHAVPCLAMPCTAQTIMSTHANIPLCTKNSWTFPLIGKDSLASQQGVPTQPARWWGLLYIHPLHCLLQYKSPNPINPRGVPLNLTIGGR